MVIDRNLAEEILDEGKDPDGKKLYEISEKIAKDISRLNTNQLRKYFGEVKKIPSNENFKYYVKRFIAVFLYNMYKSNDYRYYQQFSDSIKNLALVTSEKDLKALKRFKDFFESLVAYHKFYNTLNNQRR